VTRRSRAQEQHSLLEYYLGGKRRLPLLKEEFWQGTAGRVTRYSLAYIDPRSLPGTMGGCWGTTMHMGNIIGILWAG